MWAWTCLASFRVLQPSTILTTSDSKHLLSTAIETWNVVIFSVTGRDNLGTHIYCPYGFNWRMP